MTGSSQVDLLTLAGGKNLQIAGHPDAASFNHGVEFVVAATRTVVDQAHGAGAGLRGKLEKVVGPAVTPEGVVFLAKEKRITNHQIRTVTQITCRLPESQDPLGMFGV